MVRHQGGLDRLNFVTAVFELASIMEVFGFIVKWSTFFPLSSRLPNISEKKVCQENAI